jgi:isocitrate dehydrogenase
MTKDLAILVSDKQEWLNTKEFLAKIENNLQLALQS